MLYEQVHSVNKSDSRQTERQMITQIDEWYSLTMEDIAKLEIECMEELKEMIKSAEMSQAYYFTYVHY